jgi:hypothetical protein
MKMPQALKTRRVKETLVALDQHINKNGKQAKLLKILLELTEALIDAKRRTRPRGKKT